jgi:hypothetical protein
MKRLLILSVLTAIILGHVPVYASPLILDGGWQEFSWTGPGYIDSPADGFQITSLVPFDVKITDSYIAGDCFDMKVNNISMLQTPLVANTGIFLAIDAASAFSNPAYSSGSCLLDPGTYQIDICLTQHALGSESGGGFIQASSAVPIPAAIWLLGSGLLGLVGVRRRLS